MADFEQYRKRRKHDELEYLHMLRKLLPKGKLFGFNIGTLDEVIYDTFDSGYDTINDDDSSTDIINDSAGGSIDYASTTLGKFLSVIGAELARLEDRACDLLNESVPGLSVELTDEWYEQTLRDEVEEGLVADDDEYKKALAHGKIYNESQAATAQFFIDYADTLGFVILVNENPSASNPFICGVSKCGLVTPVGGDVHRMGNRGAFSIVEMEITGPGNNGDGNVDLMKELFNKAKPAHVYILWTDSRP